MSNEEVLYQMPILWVSGQCRYWFPKRRTCIVLACYTRNSWFDLLACFCYTIFLIVLLIFAVLLLDLTSARSDAATGDASDCDWTPPSTTPTSRPAAQTWSTTPSTCWCAANPRRTTSARCWRLCAIFSTLLRCLWAQRCQPGCKI